METGETCLYNKSVTVQNISEMKNQTMQTCLQ